MNRVEALEWAADYCERNHLTTPKLKSNGYPVDGWRQPPPEECARIIKFVADSVTEDKDRDLAASLDADLERLAEFVEAGPSMHTPAVDLLNKIVRRVKTARGAT